MYVVTERSGTPREIGFAHGREYRHGIARLMHEYLQAHTCHRGGELLERLRESSLEFHREVMGGFFDEVCEEAAGISEGSGVPEQKVILFNLHAWPALWVHAQPDHVLRNFPFAPGVRIEAAVPADHCSSMGVSDSDRGPLVAGNLDDTAMSYRLEITRPNKGYAHVDLGRLGMAGCSRCMNEAGLAVGVSSLWPLCDDWAKIDAPGIVNFDLVVRAIIQHCATVNEALDVIRDWPAQVNLVLGDASGDIARIEMSLLGNWITRPQAGWIAATNHYAAPEARKALAQHGLDWDHSTQPTRGSNTNERYARYEELMSSKEGRFTLACVKSVVADHQGWPRSICNPGSTSTIAVVREKKFLVADKAPCSNTYQEVRL